MLKNKFTPDNIRAGRIIKHGKITDLSNGFSLNGQPFTIFLVPKSEECAYIQILNVQLWRDETATNIPINVGDWSPLYISEIKPNQTILSDVDIYWGSGND